MRIGRLRHRVTVRRRRDVPDGFTGLADSLDDGADTWALVESTMSLNLREGQQVAEGTTHKVTFRHRPTLSSEHEVLHAGDTLWVRRVMHDPRKRYTIAECEQATA